MIVGAGDAGCVLVAVGSREHIGEHCNGGAYVVDETARRHGAAPEDPDDPYAHLPPSRPTRYRDGWLVARRCGLASPSIDSLALCASQSPLGGQRPSAFARSTAASPAGRIRPAAVSLATFSTLIRDQLLRRRRGV